jgi:hypothetical protein
MSSSGAGLNFSRMSGTRNIGTRGWAHTDASCEDGPAVTSSRVAPAASDGGQAPRRSDDRGRVDLADLPRVQFAMTSIYHRASGAPLRSRERSPGGERLRPPSRKSRGAARPRLDCLRDKPKRSSACHGSGVADVRAGGPIRRA